MAVASVVIYAKTSLYVVYLIYYILQITREGRLAKIVQKWGQVVGISGQSTEEVYSKRVRHELAPVLNNSTQLLYFDFDSSRMEGSGSVRVPTRLLG